MVRGRLSFHACHLGLRVDSREGVGGSVKPPLRSRERWKPRHSPSDRRQADALQAAQAAWPSTLCSGLPDPFLLFLVFQDENQCRYVKLRVSLGTVHGLSQKPLMIQAETDSTDSDASLPGSLARDALFPGDSATAEPRSDFQVKHQLCSCFSRASQ